MSSVMFLSCLTLAVLSLATVTSARRDWFIWPRSDFYRQDYYHPRCQVFPRPFDCRPYHFYLSLLDFDQCARLAVWQETDNCGAMVERFGVESVKHLEELNPPRTCDDPKSFVVGQLICVAPINVETPSGKPADHCAQPLVALAGDNCKIMADRHHSADIKGLGGDEVCGADGLKPLVPGEILCGKLGEDIPCLIYAVSKADDTCELLAERHELNSTVLLTQWNPELDCSTPIPVGRLLCVKPDIRAANYFSFGKLAAKLFGGLGKSIVEGVASGGVLFGLNQLIG